MRRLLVGIAAIVVTLPFTCIVLFVSFYLWFGVASIEGTAGNPTESVPILFSTPQP
ncbi:MAG: hypothetical protein RMK01_11030 [Thermomicrobium sp.]|nr:hypothetical protein [Thermomicrobium sp.]MDW8060596.1 hypothetical protein [Thermomicrobium sp.]